MALCKTCQKYHADYEGGNCDICASQKDAAPSPPVVRRSFDDTPSEIRLIANKSMEGRLPDFSDLKEQRGLQFYEQAKNPRHFASLVFDKPEDQLTQEEVNWAKSRLFAKMYGRKISLDDWMAATHVSREDAERMLEQFKDAWKDSQLSNKLLQEMLGPNPLDKPRTNLGTGIQSTRDWLNIFRQAYGKPGKTKFNQHGAQTGRFSANEPNMHYVDEKGHTQRLVPGDAASVVKRVIDKLRKAGAGVIEVGKEGEESL